MPAVAQLEKEVWSLWASNGQDWTLMDQGPAHEPLALKAKSLGRLFTNRRFTVVYGINKPGSARY